jgi:hypothetical protein
METDGGCIPESNDTQENNLEEWLYEECEKVDEGKNARRADTIQRQKKTAYINKPNRKRKTCLVG